MATTAGSGSTFMDMFDFSHLGEVVVRTSLVYLGLLLAMRVAGKREVGQMKPFDLVTLLIISNAVQNAMVGQDSSLVGGLGAAAVILLLNYMIGSLRRHFGLAQQIFEGSPSLLIHNGRLIPEHLRREGLSEEDVVQAMREHGIDSLDQVKSAVLEVDGSISIIQKDQAQEIRTRRRFRRQPHP